MQLRLRGQRRERGYERELSDLRTVVTALRSDQWDVQALLGHSKGAHCVLRYAWTYDDVPLVASVAARFDFSRMPSSRFSAEQVTDLHDKGGFMWRVRGKELYISRDDFNERDGVDMTRVKDIKHTRLMLLHGEEDAVIPVGDAHRIASHLATERYRLKTFRGAGHDFESDEERERLVAYVHGVLDVWMWVCQPGSG